MSIQLYCFGRRTFFDNSTKQPGKKQNQQNSSDICRKLYVLKLLLLNSFHFVLFGSSTVPFLVFVYFPLSSFGFPMFLVTSIALAVVIVGVFYRCKSIALAKQMYIQQNGKKIANGEAKHCSEQFWRFEIVRNEMNGQSCSGEKRAKDEEKS